MIKRKPLKSFLSKRVPWSSLSCGKIILAALQWTDRGKGITRKGVAVVHDRNDGCWGVGVLQMCTREDFGGGTDRTWWWTGCGGRRTSINRLPTRTLSGIIKAHVSWVPRVVVHRTGTLGWGGQRGYNPNHTLTCTFQAVSLAQGCVQRKGAFFYWFLTKRCYLLTKLSGDCREHLLLESHQGPLRELHMWFLSCYSYNVWFTMAESIPRELPHLELL